MTFLSCCFVKNQAFSLFDDGRPVDWQREAIFLLCEKKKGLYCIIYNNKSDYGQFYDGATCHISWLVQAKGSGARPIIPQPTNQPPFNHQMRPGLDQSRYQNKSTAMSRTFPDWITFTWFSNELTMLCGWGRNDGIKVRSKPQGAFNEWCIFQEPVPPPFPLYLDIIMLSDFITFILNIPIFQKTASCWPAPLPFRFKMRTNSKEWTFSQDLNTCFQCLLIFSNYAMRMKTYRHS